jgi:hypothetical protein
MSISLTILLWSCVGVAAMANLVNDSYYQPDNFTFLGALFCVAILIVLAPPVFIFGLFVSLVDHLEAR